MNRQVRHIVGIAVAMGCGIAAGQQDFESVRIKATHVAGKVHMLEGRGGNIGVSVGQDGVLIVDDQFAPLVDKIRTALRVLGKGKPRFILNTHYHADHVGGNEAFGRDGTILAHSNVRKRLSTRQDFYGRSVEPLPKVALPIITFDESLSIHFNGEEIRAIHYPNSHTDGDIVIFFTKSNVVHMGDLFFSGMFPFVDLDHGGDVEGLTESVGKILAELPKGAKIIPGHGPLSTTDDLKTYHRMLVETTRIVRERLKAGKTLEQIKADGLPDPWKSWGSGFISTDKWLESIVKSLSK